MMVPRQWESHEPRSVSRCRGKSLLESGILVGAIQEFDVSLRKMLHSSSLLEPR
ncbi:hypothetical protein ATKI12_8833 [Kitasatospora sp. Ki12]